MGPPPPPPPPAGTNRTAAAEAAESEAGTNRTMCSAAAEPRPRSRGGGGVSSAAGPPSTRRRRLGPCVRRPRARFPAVAGEDGGPTASRCDSVDGRITAAGSTAAPTAVRVAVIRTPSVLLFCFEGCKGGAAPARRVGSTRICCSLSLPVAACCGLLRSVAASCGLLRSVASHCLVLSSAAAWAWAPDSPVWALLVCHALCYVPFHTETITA